MSATGMLVTVFGLAVTGVAYAASLVLRRRYASPFTTPVLVSTVLVIVVLFASGISFEQYLPADRLITSLLAPATVALALPIYKNRHVFFRNLLPAGCGLLAGSLGTMVAAALLAREFMFPSDLASSIAIKSATVPIAVEVAKVVHGTPALTALFVVATGVLGAALGPWLLDRLGIGNPMIRGLALGTISHGIGTAQAASESELAGAVAGVAMGLGAVCTALAAPIVLPLLV